MVSNSEETAAKSPTDSSGSPEREALAGLEKVLAHFAASFEASAQRWERMVYPAILVFGALGVSGFWLIYSLTSDVRSMSSHIASLDSSSKCRAGGHGRYLCKTGYLAAPADTNFGNERVGEGLDDQHGLHESGHGRDEPEYRASHVLYELILPLVARAKSISYALPAGPDRPAGVCGQTPWQLCEPVSPDGIDQRDSRRGYSLS